MLRHLNQPLCSSGCWSYVALHVLTGCACVFVCMCVSENTHLNNLVLSFESKTKASCYLR